MNEPSVDDLNFRDRAKADTRPQWTETCDPAPPIVHGIPVTSNAVHQHADGTWGFFNEVWTDCMSPFATQDEATAACKKYAATL